MDEPRIIYEASGQDAGQPWHSATLMPRADQYHPVTTSELDDLRAFDGMTTLFWAVGPSVVLMALDRLCQLTPADSGRYVFALVVLALVGVFIFGMGFWTHYRHTSKIDAFKNRVPSP